MPEKSERLLVDEINSNNEFTEQGLKHRLDSRKLFCEQVNEAFGLNISVKLKNPPKESSSKEVELNDESISRSETTDNL